MTINKGRYIKAKEILDQLMNVLTNKECSDFGARALEDKLDDAIHDETMKDRFCAERSK